MIADGELIDFHSHFYEPSWFPNTAQQGVFARAWPLLTDIEAQLAAMEGAGIAAKVLSAPAATLLAAGREFSEDMMKRINDRFAELVARYPDRLLGLATIDAFAGEQAALEVERAVKELGLGGICVDCSQDGRYLDVPEARPVFEVAAQLDIPVFVHPVSPSGLTERLGRLGHAGILLARGTEDAASLLALLRSGLLDDLPTLKLVLPMIGAAVFLFAGIADLEYSREDGWRGERPGLLRRRLYVDTMGFDAASLRFVIDLLGVEHVLLGSDWPIMPLMTRAQVEEVLASLHLTAEEQHAVLAGNTLRLMRGDVRAS